MSVVIPSTVRGPCVISPCVISPTVFSNEDGGGTQKSVFDDLAIWLDDEDITPASGAYSGWVNRANGSPLVTIGGGANIVANYAGVPTSRAIDNGVSGRYRINLDDPTIFDGDYWAAVAGTFNALGTLNTRAMVSHNQPDGTFIGGFGKGTNGAHRFCTYRGGTTVFSDTGAGVTPEVYEWQIQSNVGSLWRSSVAHGTGAVSDSPVPTDHARLFITNTSVGDFSLCSLLVLPRIPTPAERVELYNYLAAKAGKTPL